MPEQPAVRFALPAPALRPFVACYWHLDASGHGGTERFLPGLPFAWIMSIADPGEIVIDGAKAAQPAAFVKGLMRSTSEVINAAGACNYGVAFNAGCASAFHRPPLDHLANRLTDMAAMGDAALSSLARSAATASFAEATTLFDRFLLARLGEARDPGLGRVLLTRLPLMEAAGAERLADACGVSVRHLRRLYRAEFGTGPKQVQRILRLRRATDLLRRGGGAVADIAARCGYADQAHLAADFRAMVGVPASGLGRASYRLADLFDLSETAPV